MNYNHVNKATSDNSVIIDDCRIENCYGCCLYLNVESEYLDSIDIDGCTFDSCEKGTDQFIVDNCKFNNCRSKQRSVYVFYWDVNKASNENGELTFNSNAFYFEHRFRSCCIQTYPRRKKGYYQKLHI